MEGRVEMDKAGVHERKENVARENERLRGDLLTLARRVSLDFRSPLGGIISSGEALKEILADTDPESLPLVASALASAEELSRLIQRVSFVLKATAVPIAPTPTEMGEAVTAALQRLEVRAMKQGAIITQPASWPQVDGVAVWLDAIWWNLVGNALQHAGSSPVRIQLGWTHGKGKTEFWVTDNGGGVSEAKRKKLFQPFDTLHEDGATGGLGLSIVQRLVELQGGSCGYRSSEAGGACFYFFLH